VNEPIAIRLATRHDAEAIARLSRSEIEYGLLWRWTPSAVLRAMSRDDVNVAVAHDAHALLGFGIMEYHDLHAHLVLFAVQPDRRKHGVGSALLAWLEAVALTAGIVKLKVEARVTNRTGIHFYRKHGYRLVATEARYYRGVEDGVRLAKQVGSAALADGFDTK
jgi:[ribosomal protein S18]-alanine N-acetyltransferase